MVVLTVLKKLIFGAACVLAGVFIGGWYFGHFGPIATYRIQLLDESNVKLTYPELAAIMLGAVAVLVTVLGIGVAVLAVWGYGQLNEQARKAATKHLKKELKKGGALKGEVDELIVAHIKDEIATPGSPLRKLLTDQFDLFVLSHAEAREEAEEAVDEESEYGDGKK
jgi:hypothetical protein